MTNLENLKAHLTEVNLSNASKQERSEFFKTTAAKFGTSWQTVVGTYFATKKHPTVQTVKPIAVPVAIYKPRTKMGLEETLIENLKSQKEQLLKEIKKTRPEPVKKVEVKPFKDKCLLEISIPDLHIGKHSWNKETGDDYDIKIACERYTKAVEALLSRVDLNIVDRILLPVGNDMINIDNKINTTTNGTPQSVDSRFGKMFQAARNLLVSTIDKLSTIAPVDVVIVAGNHDNVTMFTLGEVLDAYYHTNSNILVNNSPKQRKYYKYGISGILLTHGNEERPQDLGLIFATEEPKLWGETTSREVQLGHFHKTKRTEYVSVDEYQGFKVRVLPSLSGIDSWHYSKGYNSKKAAQAFLYHKSEGLIAEYTYSIN